MISWRPVSLKIPHTAERIGDFLQEAPKDEGGDAQRQSDKGRIRFPARILRIASMVAG
jgi:hypothetical protein